MRQNSHPFVISEMAGLTFQFVQRETLCCEPVMLNYCPEVQSGFGCKHFHALRWDHVLGLVKRGEAR